MDRWIPYQRKVAEKDDGRIENMNRGILVGLQLRFDMLYHSHIIVACCLALTISMTSVNFTSVKH